VRSGEGSSVGIVFCSGKNDALGRYATDRLSTKLLAREYLSAWPKEKVLATHWEKARHRRKSEK
jgi:hypothetical protein